MATKVFISFVFLLVFNVVLSLPFDVDSHQPTKRGFRLLLPNTRQRRAEEEGEGGRPGIQEFITTAIKDGIAATSALESPTMMVGGFSIMIQPMPNGTEFAGQLMQMAPNYLSLLPGLGRK